MPRRGLVWDIETVPDLAGYAAANGHDGKHDDAIRPSWERNSQSTSIIRLSASEPLIAHWEGDHWAVEALGAPQSVSGLRRNSLPRSLTALPS